MKIKDGTTGPFDPGDYVVYIPRHLLLGDKQDMIKNHNLGTVTKINERFVFVKYIGKNKPEATRPEDLYFVNGRADLVKTIKSDE